MKARSKTPPKKATNLTLSDKAKKAGAWLVSEMRRPSLSNVIETLIFEKQEAIKPPATPAK